MRWLPLTSTVVLGLLSPLAAQTGTWVSYGTGRGGSGLANTIVGVGAPNIGKVFEIRTSPPVINGRLSRLALLGVRRLDLTVVPSLHLYVDPLAVVPMTNTITQCGRLSTCHWSYLRTTVPTSAALVGQKFYAQAVRYDPVVNPQLNMSTNGLAITVGR